MKCLPWFMLSVMFCLFSQVTLGSDKYALLIGVTTYKNSHMNGTRLTYPEADATAVGELLKNSGYEVHVLLGKDADRKSIEEALGEFETHGSQDGVVVIGLFGHGVQYGSEAYFCPYDTSVRKVTDSQDNVLLDKRGQPRLEPDPGSLTSMQRLLEALNTSGAGNRVLLADCCRNDPSVARDPLFTELTDRAFGSTVTINDLKPGTAVMFSCSDGERSFEHSQWEHGAFTKAFLEYCGQLNEGSDSTVSTMMTPLSRRVSAMVSDLSPGKNQKINPITNGIVDLQLRLSVPSEITNSIGMKLKLIPAGEFLMGSSDADVDEKPKHRAEISQSFYAGVHEVTVGQTLAWLNSPNIHISDKWIPDGGENSPVRKSGSRWERNSDSKFGQSDDQPMVNISWYGAVAFCEWCTKKDQKLRYRLPTEVEWEYFARAGSTTEYPWGDSLNGEEANVDGENPYGTDMKGPKLGVTTTIGRYPANDWGLFDTIGNVSEWCGDNAEPDKPGFSRVLRGGAWDHHASYCRSASRTRYDPEQSWRTIGFRVIAE